MKVERQEWLEQRRAGIGGSDIAALLGLSKWKSPYQLYLDKRGELPEQDDSEAMYWGRELEPVIRRRYELETGFPVIHEENRIIQHPEFPFMLASLDGRIDQSRILEIKTARTADGWGEIGTSEIPLPYALQCQWYLMITDSTIADVAVLIGGSDFRMYQIDEDIDLQDMLKNAAIEFWQRVQDGNPPDVTTLADAVERYGKADAAGTAICTEEVYKAWDELTNEVKPALKHYEEKEEELKAVVCKYMADKYDTIVTPDGAPIATWKLAKGRAGFNSKQLQLDHPELCKKYVTIGESARRLLIK